MLTKSRRLFLFALPALLAPAGSSQSFQGIGDLTGGTFESYAYGISADGSTVVGQSTSAAGKVAVYWRDGVLIALGDLTGGAVESLAMGANHDGSILVGQGRDATAHRPLRWDGPGFAMTQLAQPAGFAGGATAMGISANGKTICGWATNNQLFSYSSVSAFRIDDGVLTLLPYTPQSQPTISDSANSGGPPSADGNVIVGRVRTSGLQFSASYWTGSTLHLPPALDGTTTFSQIFGVSADGNVRVGHSHSSLTQGNLQGEACRWVGNVPQSLGDLAGGNSIGAALAANNDGSVVVGYANAAGGARAFVWTPAAGMRDLGVVLTNDFGLDLTNWTLDRATGITPDGSAIVGWGRNPNGASEGWIARLSCATSASHCTAKTNSLGCVPMIFGTGIPSASANSGFVVRATKMRNKMPGLMLYGFNGAASLPFQGGTLCVAAPFFRSVGLNSGGSAAGNDCTGVYSLDVNAFAHGLSGGAPHPSLTVPGTTVNCQFWGRDTGFTAPNNSQLSNGLRFEICD